jgi:acetyl esterase/lipase
MNSSFSLDPQIAHAMSSLSSDGTTTSAVTWQSLRSGNEALYPILHKAVPAHPEVRTKRYIARAADGTPLDLTWFTKDDTAGSAVVHAHGGGRVAGSVSLYAPYLADYVARSGIPFLSVEYRRAPEVGGAVPTEDVYAGLLWLVENAEQLGVDPSRLGVVGDSAGGGLVAGVTLLARDNGVPLAGQLLTYPMLDDRTTSADVHQAPFNMWLESANAAGWNALLGELRGTDAVLPVVAPGRTTDYVGLPRAYLEVGELDLFRDETVAYATGLWAAGVSTELHVIPGATHGFDHWAPAAKVTERAMAGRIAFLQSL